MFKVTDYVSFGTDKGMQALEAFQFLLDIVQTFYALINPINIWLPVKFNTIVLNFQLLTWLSKWRNMVSTVEPWFNKPWYNKILSITNDFHGPSNSKLYKKEP